MAGRTSVAGSALVRVSVPERGSEPPLLALMACIADVVRYAGELELHGVTVLFPTRLAVTPPAVLDAGLRWFDASSSSQDSAIDVTIEVEQQTHRAQVTAWEQILTVDGPGSRRLSRLQLRPSTNAPVVLRPPVLGELWSSTTTADVTIEARLPTWTVESAGWLACVIADDLRRYGLEVMVVMSVRRRPPVVPAT